jgi:DMSO reductase family type II enzyme heme b subunit
MQVPFVASTSLEELLQPDGPLWRGARAERIALAGTPVGLQPTAAIRVAWTNRRIGAVGEVEVAALCDGQRLAFRLEWPDPSENRELVETTAFPDGAAVLLPVVQGAPVLTMGGPGQAVNAWYWRADENGAGRQVVAEGIGTSRTVDVDLVKGHGVWKEGRWRVVIARSLRVDVGEPVAQLAAGETTGFAVAVWDGGNGERAGIKSFSGDWRELALAAPPRARR